MYPDRLAYYLECSCRHEHITLALIKSVNRKVIKHTFHSLRVFCPSPFRTDTDYHVLRITNLKSFASIYTSLDKFEAFVFKVDELLGPNLSPVSL